ncbi:hypothetical protein ES703_24396 [subsurface metagenome]
MIPRQLSNKIKKRFLLIKEGRNFIDKIKIFFKFFGIEKPIYLSNEYGLFYIRPKSSDLWQASPQGEKDINTINYFKIPERGCFIDVGANIGRYSIMLAKKYPNSKIISFEPEENNFKVLKNNIHLNKLKNVLPLQLACLDKKEKIDFYISLKSTGQHSLIKKTNKRIQVEANKLDYILNNLKIKKVDLIKIDVEGAEAEVLKGAIKILKKSHPKIIFEAWDEQYLKKVKKILNKFNYKIKKIAEENYFAY